MSAAIALAMTEHSQIGSFVCPKRSLSIEMVLQFYPPDAHRRKLENLSLAPSDAYPGSLCHLEPGSSFLDGQA